MSFWRSKTVCKVVCFLLRVDKCPKTAFLFFVQNVALIQNDFFFRMCLFVFIFGVVLGNFGNGILSAQYLI
jgi:hypothetical protein